MTFEKVHLPIALLFALSASWSTKVAAELAVPERPLPVEYAPAAAGPAAGHAAPSLAPAGLDTPRTDPSSAPATSTAGPGAAPATSADAPSAAPAIFPALTDRAAAAPESSSDAARAQTVVPAGAPLAREAAGQRSPASNGDGKKGPEKKEHWYERIKIRGYTQFRFNRLPSFDRNDSLINEQGDRSIGDNNSFFIRRARVILYGDVSDYVSIYFQPDFASMLGDQGGVAILRDWYADIFLDEKKEYRIRLGQSKVPFGFENMQSSQNRLPLDRNDALNSALRDERDLGAFFYWAPQSVRKLFKHLVDSGLKGSGDYGAIGIGLFNGQTANQRERNDNRHMIARVTWPFEIGGQILEVGGGGYYGQFNVTTQDQRDEFGNTVTFRTTDPGNNIVDARVHGHFVLYPQPFGIQAEYNVGRGPALGKVLTTVVDERSLHGGYATLSFKVDGLLGTPAFIPFVRGTYYEGGKKFFVNAPRYSVREIEGGIEWQLHQSLEVVLAYQWARRTSDRYPYRLEEGQLTRVQVQWNY